MIRHDQIQHAGLTDVGIKRSHNQDNFAIQMLSNHDEWLELGHFFLVADGMGGHAVGEKASEQAARTIPHIYHKYARDGVPEALRKAFQEANASIHSVGEQNNEFRGMGTTSTGLVVLEKTAWIAHVGDSRAYRIRGGVIQQLTYDHSYVWEYARRKHIDPSEVQDLPSNVIHRCLGPQPFVEVDIEGPYDLEMGDIFLMCSDGLSGQVTDHEIGVVCGILPPEEACRFLVDLANLRGGPDNITTIIVQIGNPDNSTELPTKPPKIRKPSIFSRVPWPFQALFFGILLAGGAIGLKRAGIGDGLALFLFIIAVIPCIAGLVGLVIHQRRESERQANQIDYEPHVYRQSPCHLDTVLLSKIEQAANSLKTRAEEQRWDPDIPSYEYHQRLAKEMLEDGDLHGAFREMCRAMMPLSEAFTRHQSKEESFRPVWDKTH